MNPANLIGSAFKVHPELSDLAPTIPQVMGQGPLAVPGLLQLSTGLSTVAAHPQSGLQSDPFKTKLDDVIFTSQPRWSLETIY